MKRTLLSLIALVPLVAFAAERKPNFLFIYTDDQRWDAMSVVQREEGEHGRFPWFQTPNMDRLASEGVRFRNAFVTLSLCSPSRAVFLTGRYNHLNGVANNRTAFPTDSVTYAGLLSAAGYATAFVGKWHMDTQHGQRPHFMYSASFIGQGRYFDCPFEINGHPTPTKGWVDDVATDYAIQFIKDHHDVPFSVSIGYKACHGPCQPPDRAKDRFPETPARPVPNLRAHAIYRQGGQPEDEKARKQAAKQMSANPDYFRCISAADDNLGRLLKTLDDLGLVENTVVIFTSDNGYYKGEHGLGDKRSVYDESLRIPLIVRYPKLAPKARVLDEMVLNLDVAPTLLDLAGVSVPAEMQGRSWQPLLAGKTAGWRKAFLIEYFLETQYPTTPTMFGVRSDDAKLVKYPGHEEWTELFDLANDPFELKNLVADPAHKDLLVRMQGELDQQVKLTQFRIPDYADKPGEGGPAVKKGGKKKKGAGEETPQAK